MGSLREDCDRAAAAALGKARAYGDEHIHDACIVDAKAGEPTRSAVEYLIAQGGCAVSDGDANIYTGKQRLETDSAKRKSFSHAEYDKIVQDTVEQLKKLGTLKGGEYAGDDDRLANFRRNGEALNLPMEAVWHTYTAKHWDAVTQYIRDLVHGKSRERLEPLAGRLDDIIVYCVLFKAMLAERGLPI